MKEDASRIFNDVVHLSSYMWKRVTYSTVMVAALVAGLWLRAAEKAAPRIRLDQVGYETNAAKLAMRVAGEGSGPASFQVLRASDRRQISTGKWSAAAFDPDSAQYIQTADFSSVRTEGNYVLRDADGASSAVFRIGSDVFRRVYYLAARGFYGQRCGTAVDLGSEFPGYRHAICHTVGDFHPSSGKNGPHVSAKGWHDAGDYGRYVVNSGISTATLLYATEMFGSKTSNITLRLPESGNGTPDLLNEARWSLEWMLSMQDQDGGVWHKQTSAQFCPFVLPENDKLPSEVIGSGQSPFKTTCATADLAAVAAIAARLYAPYDAAFARQSLTAAEAAWQWVENNENVTFQNPAGVGTGDYGDKDCSDERFWAAAELARTTGKPIYSAYVKSNYQAFLPQLRADQPPDWSHVAAFGLWSYAMGKDADPVVRSEIQARSLELADSIVKRQGGHAYRIALVRHNYIWGSNGVAANYCLQLLMANQLKPDPSYLAAVREDLHYLLGRNAVGLSFVTQIGSNPVKHIHHRPSGSDTMDEPWPGLLAGGPNPGRQDAEMKQAVTADTPPALAYIDLQGAYACNEIAINWQAPLVFALAGVL